MIKVFLENMNNTPKCITTRKTERRMKFEVMYIDTSKNFFTKMFLNVCYFNILF